MPPSESGPEDHRPPRPQTQGEKQEGDEEAGDHTQLKGQENSRKSKATDSHLTDGESRKETMEILKTVRRATDSADSCKQNQKLKRNQEILGGSFTEMKADLKATDRRENNAQECITDLGEEQKSPSPEQTESQMKKKKAI